MIFNIPEPDLQVGFSQALADMRVAMLQEALAATVRKLDIPEIDRELAQIVSAHSLASLAGYGLRGEMLFPVPTVLTANPRLLGYYRLLYGYSQKEFYKSGVGGQFKAFEVSGAVSARNAPALFPFCRAMAQAGELLLAGISAGRVNAGVLDDLTLLTLGPQLRGGANVKIGIVGIAAVFGAIKEIVGGSIQSADHRQIQLKNAAGRIVLIEFAADPDIIIREEMRAGSFRQLVAIEVKGGRDFSNIHNRIGEAEKSHQKARVAGYIECWTVVNVNKIDIAMAKQESPTTNRFYRMSDLVAASGTDYIDFRDRIVSLTGILV